MDFLAYAMGGAGAPGGEGQGGGFGAFIPLILMFAIFYFLLIRPQQKKAKQHKAVLATLKKGGSGCQFGRPSRGHHRPVRRRRDLGDRTESAGQGFPGFHCRGHGKGEPIGESIWGWTD